jgi:hypothetical protein
MIVDAHAPVYVMRRAANWSRFNSCWATFRWRPRSDTWAASSGCGKPSTTRSGWNSEPDRAPPAAAPSQWKRSPLSVKWARHCKHYGVTRVLSVVGITPTICTNLDWQSAQTAHIFAQDCRPDCTLLTAGSRIELHGPAAECGGALFGTRRGNEYHRVFCAQRGDSTAEKAAPPGFARSRRGKR